MVRVGAEVETRVRGRLRVVRSLGRGSQGALFETRADDGSILVLKVFRPEFQNEGARRRLAAVLSQKLQETIESIVPPLEMVDLNGTVGHVSEKAPGISLESLLFSREFNMLDGIQMGCALARTISVIHERGLAHGDIDSSNVLVVPDGIFRIYLIDFDNLVGPGLPEAPCLGHDLYMAPEIRNGTGSPSIESDLFSLSVAIHQLVVLRHPIPIEASDKEFNEMMGSGSWLDVSVKSAYPFGYPIDVLGAELLSLLRRGVSANTRERPSAREWQDALYASMFRVIHCPHCKTPRIANTPDWWNEIDRNFCPMCDCLA